jgi:hypothetical protein
MKLKTLKKNDPSARDPAAGRSAKTRQAETKACRTNGSGGRGLEKETNRPIHHQRSGLARHYLEAAASSGQNSTAAGEEDHTGRSAKSEKNAQSFARTTGAALGGDESAVGG